MVGSCGTYGGWVNAKKVATEETEAWDQEEMAGCTWDDWYQQCQERKTWRALCSDSMGEVAACRKNTCAANRPAMMAAAGSLEGRVI